MLQVNDIVRIKGEPERQFYVVELWPGTGQISAYSSDYGRVVYLPRHLLEIVSRA